MKKLTFKVQAFFLTCVCCAALALCCVPVSAAKPQDIRDMAADKVRSLDIESGVLMKLIDDEKKLIPRCAGEDDVQIHRAIIRSYHKIIALNNDKIRVWKALLCFITNQNED